MEGRKDDSGKVRLELIPPSLLTAVGTILTFGAVKYAPRNWEQGISWGRVFGALMRHMWAWWKGENTDPETGKSHLWHAGCCIAFLIEYEDTHPEFDDRPKPTPCSENGTAVGANRAYEPGLCIGSNRTASNLLFQNPNKGLLSNP